ncbi:MAG: arginine repressor [Candidatus Glassbacteria bacterium]|nr:arginine repressor [Candidatus Glassbacteria bacterium]
MSDSRSKRRSLVMKIITDTPVSSQEQLLELLAARGIRTTQATISRDIRDLGLVKAAVGTESYRYLPPGRRAGTPGGGFLGEAIHSIRCAGHLLVIQTRPGYAQSVAGAVDSLGWAELLGTVGGDDTVLIVAADPQTAEEARLRLARFFAVETG